MIDAKMRPATRPANVLLGLAVFLGLAGCDKAPPAQQAPPPPNVTVSEPLQREVVVWDTYTGHLEAPQSANVVARVSGLIEQMPFAEGAIVKKGDVLAIIDDRPFKADLELKNADKKKAEAAAAVAKTTLDRYKSAVAAKAVSQQDLDTQQANYDQAEASVAAAQASIDLSKLNLEWSKVLSPIDGRVSNKMVTEGNYVTGGSGTATMLTTVQSVSPMYCYVDVDEHSVLKYQKLSADGKLTNARDGKVPCYVQLGNEPNFPHDGTIDFVDNHVDSGTGTQRVRGVLQNKTGLLTPGFFARMLIPGSAKSQALLIPDSSIGNDQSHKTVMVVGKGDTVETRQVEIGSLFGQLRVITSGITAEDRVIINGLIQASRVQPGMTVKATAGEIKVPDESIFSGPGGDASHAMATTAESTSQATPQSTTESRQ